MTLNNQIPDEVTLAELTARLDREHRGEADPELIQYLKELPTPTPNELYQEFRWALLVFTRDFVRGYLSLIPEEDDDSESTVGGAFVSAFLMGIIFGRTSKEEIGPGFPVWRGESETK